MKIWINKNANETPTFGYDDAKLEKMDLRFAYFEI